MNATIILVNHRKPFFVVTFIITPIIHPSQPMSIQMLNVDKTRKIGSIIFVVGKSPMDIMEPILCRKKVP